MAKVKDSKLSHADDKLVLGEVYNLASCLSAETVEFSEANVKFYFEYSCDDKNLEKFSGSKLDSTFNIDPDIGCDTSGKLWNIEGEYTATTTLSNGSKLTISFVRRLYAGSSVSTICNYTKTGNMNSLSDDCEFKASKKIKSLKVDGVETEDDSIGDDLVFFEPASITVSTVEAGDWYSSGTMTGSVNQWEGTVSYSDTNPSISFTSPNGFTATGSLGLK